MNSRIKWFKDFQGQMTRVFILIHGVLFLTLMMGQPDVSLCRFISISLSSVLPWFFVFSLFSISIDASNIHHYTAPYFFTPSFVSSGLHLLKIVYAVHTYRDRSSLAILSQKKIHVAYFTVFFSPKLAGLDGMKDQFIIW